MAAPTAPVHSTQQVPNLCADINGVACHIFTPFAKGTSKRVVLWISVEDYGRFNNLPGRSSTVTVTDVPSGLAYKVRPASCGLGCYCAARVVVGGLD